MSPLDTLVKSVVNPIKYLHLNPVWNFLCPDDPTAVRPAFGMSQGEDSWTEVRSKRTVHSKTFQVGLRDFKVITSPRIIHYDNNGVMEEIDLKIEDIDGKKVVTKAPYKIEVFTDRVGYHFKKPGGSHFIIELVKIGDLPVDNMRLQSTVKGCQVFYDGLACDVFMKVMLSPAKPEIFTRIASPSAPRSFTWKITQYGKFEFKSFGGDSNKDSLEILVDQQPIDANSFFYTETWTGRISRKDKKSRIKRWFDDPAYPVIIDPTVTIEIAAQYDKGSQYVFKSYYNGSLFLARTLWYSSQKISIGNQNEITNASFKGYKYGGVRFQNVGVPKDATIVSAHLKLYVNYVTNNLITIKIFGDKVANAGKWNAPTLPTQINKTTSSALWSPTAKGLTTISVTNQVASIVGLGSWASNNALRFGFFPQTQTGSHYVAISSLTTSIPVTNNPNFSLAIVYSVSGGGNPRLGDMNFMGI